MSYQQQKEAKMRKFKRKFKKIFKFAVFVFAVLKFFVDVADIVDLFKRIFMTVIPLIAFRGLDYSSPRPI